MAAAVVAIKEYSLLDVVRAEQRAAREAEVRMLVAVVEFAVAHPPLEEADRCRVKVAESLEGPVVTEALNGAGVPVVSAVAVARLAATLGLSPAAGQGLVAEALELAYRLPALFGQVRTGTVPAWRARRVAKATLGLSPEAAGFVDRQLGGLSGQISIRSLDALVAEAIARHDQTRLRQQIQARTDPRHFTVELGQCDLLGQVPVHGLVDLPDAIALESALGHAAQQLAASGPTESRDARRARAAGDLARTHLNLTGQPAPTGTLVYDDANGTLTPVLGHHPHPDSDSDPDATEPDAAWARMRRAGRREVMLHLHITDRELLSTLRGTDQNAPSDPPGVVAGRPLLGRAEHTSTGDLPITADSIRAWCGAANSSIRVLPVLDIAGRIHHDGYEIPERLREQIINRDHTCVYPGCTRAARACDLDHIEPYHHQHPVQSGATATENLAPLCRRHHRLKTTGRVSYVMTAPGQFTWDLGTGATITRDHHGTQPPHT